MIKKLNIGSLRFTFSFSPIIKVTGVNSYVGNGMHFLMWDFDDISLRRVRVSLKTVQTRYALSDIHIARTKPAGGYHAYCFTAVDWQRAMEIVAATRHVDLKYFKWSVFRGRFTLRVSEKLGRISYKVAILEGWGRPDVTIKDLKAWVIYETVGGGEWWHAQTKSMLSWYRHWICLLKLHLPMRSGKRS